ncbi:MAG: hypothetical protein UE295_05375 [Acutalibacteraceae bacterium]|nr:hypothetical protein [Acutalibacteraceae bacterium]
MKNNGYDKKYTYYDIYGLCREKDGKTERYIEGKWEEVPNFNAKKYVEEHFMDFNLEADLTEEQYEMLL